MRSIKNKILLTLIIASLVISIIGAIPVSAGLFCGGMGTSGLQPKSKAPNFSQAILPEFGARDYSIDEMFGPSSYKYSIPFGTTDGDWLWRQENKAVEENATSLSSDAQEKLSQYGKDYNCSGFGLDGFGPSVTSVSMSMTNSIATIIKGLVTTLFNSQFICKDPSSPDSSCVNLLGIYGGTQGGDGGLIGALSNGIFMPLAALAFVFTAFYLLYEALIKRQFRLGLQSLLWSLVVFALGIFVMLKPWMVARFPQAVNEVISNCVVSAMNGQSCMDSDNYSQEAKFVDDICKSSFVGGDANKQLQAQLSSMTCMISKTFTIDRWAQQQFGYSFDELYTKDPPDGKNVYTKIEGSPSDYCVNMYSTNSPITLMKDPSNIRMEGQKQVCNVALAYMANTTIGDYGTKATMGDIIATATKDDAMWKAFTGNDRELMGTFALLAAIAAAFSFIPVVVFGHVYSLSATLLMVFAPIFVLFGIEPSKGRRIFLGWLEAVFSSIMKYFASSLLVLIMLVIYSAVMSQLKGMMVFISSIILCFTFYFYRKEIVNMIGVVNMGGQRLSNKFGDAINRTGQKAKSATSAVVGGAIGGAVASNIAGESTFKGAVSGVKTGAGMQMRRGSGVVANVVRSGSRVEKDLAREREKLEKLKNEQQMQEAAQETAKKTAEQISQATQDRTNRIIKEQRDRNVSSKRDYIDIESATVRNDDMKKQIKEYKDRNINNTKEEQELEVSFTNNMDMIREAKNIDKYVEENHGNAEVAKERMISDYMRQQKQQMLDDYTELSNDKDIKKSMSEVELNTELQNFLASEGERLDRLEQSLRDNFSTIGEGEDSRIHHVSLEEQIRIKNRTIAHNEARKENFRKRLYKNIDQDIEFQEEE